MKLPQLNFYIMTLYLLASCSPIPPNELFKECHEVVFRIEDGVEVKKEEWKIIHEYDKQGEVNKILYYDNDADTLSRYTERHLDSQSGIVTHTSFDALGTKQDWSEALLQDEKIIWNKSYNASGKLTGIMKYKFDAKGRQTEVLYLTKDETIQNRIVTDYDDEKSISTETRYNTKGKKPYWTVKKYDDSGNVIARERYGPSNKLIDIFEYDYSGGKRRSETLSVAGKIITKTQYEYGSGGNASAYRIYRLEKDSGELKLHTIQRSKYTY